MHPPCLTKTKQNTAGGVGIYTLTMPAGPPRWAELQRRRGGGGERTAEDVHATLCALVTTEAAKHSAWAEYAAVLLDEETEAFFAGRLPEAKAKAAEGESNPPSKKRKTDHASNAAEGITLRVACLDGSSLELTVPPRELVREVKRAIGQVRRGRLGLLMASRR